MRQLTPHEEFYNVPKLHEIYIVNQQTYEKCFIGYCIDHDSLEALTNEINLYLKDYPNFYVMSISKIANEHTDNYMERVEDFVKYSFNWTKA